MSEDALSNGSLRIAFVVDRFHPAKGGGEAYVQRLAETLSRQGHEVRIFAREMAGESETLRVHTVPSLPLGKSLRLISFAFGARNLLRSMNFDVTHGTGKCLGVTVYNPHGGVERAWLKANAQSCHSFGYRTWVRLKRVLSLRHHFILWQQRKILGSGGARRIIAISDMVKEDMVRAYGTDPERIDVVYNGVDLERFSPERGRRLRDGTRRSLNLAPEDVMLLTVANNFRLKGIRTLVESLPSLAALVGDRPFRLFVAGRGREGPYRRLARRLGVGSRIEFLGVRRDMEALYGAADLYVHPTFFDACSLVLFEAMASGLPVVTTRANGAAWALTGGEGTVLETPGDGEALARAMAPFFDPAERARAGAQARKTAERYPEEENADRIVAVYRRLVSEEVPG